MLFVSREAWGAPASSPAASISSTRGVKVHYLGSPYSSRARGGCDDQVRQIRAAHLNHPTEDYSDIAYNALVCEHGYVYEGRGAHKRTGANGSASLNLAHYAVCALLGSSGMTRPTDLMLHGIRDAIEWLRSAGDAGAEIKGHRDGHATSCPGDPLYAWVRAGAPRPGDSPTEDDMALTDDDIKRIWSLDDTVPNGNSATNVDNPKIPAGSSLQFNETVTRQTKAKVDALDAKVDALAAQVAELAAVELTPEQVAAIAAAVTDTVADAIAEQVAVKLAARLAE